MILRTLCVALWRRELGRRPGLVLTAWLLLGAGAALAHAELSGTSEPPELLLRLLDDFDVTLATVLAFVSALHMIVRSADDREHGWLIGWCGSGGGRARYVLALYVVAVVAMAAALAAGSAAFAIARAALGAGVNALRWWLELLTGVVLIGGVAAYGLAIGILVQRVVPAVLIGALLFLAPFIASAVIVVVQDLPGLPASARFWVLHLPSPLPATTVTAFCRQLSYVAIVVGFTTWVARYRVCRVT